jgi:hypothetical protein
VSRPVYSTRFIAEANAGLHGTYTVPPGYLAIVRDITLWCDSPQAGWGLVSCIASLGVVIFATPFDHDNTSYSWQGRAVVNELEEISCDSSTGLIYSAIVSGYLLTLP